MKRRCCKCPLSKSCQKISLLDFLCLCLSLSPLSSLRLFTCVPSCSGAAVRRRPPARGQRLWAGLGRAQPGGDGAGKSKQLMTASYVDEWIHFTDKKGELGWPPDNLLQRHRHTVLDCRGGLWLIWMNSIRLQRVSNTYMHASVCSPGFVKAQNYRICVFLLCVESIQRGCVELACFFNYAHSFVTLLTGVFPCWGTYTLVKLRPQWPSAV